MAKTGKFFEAVFILSGMIIGAGMFGIPFSFARAGFWLGLAELVALSGVILLLHLLYGDMVLHTPEFHRLPGYVKKYLGAGAAKISWASAFFGISFSLLAYLILGSIFLRNVFAGFGKNISEPVFVLAILAISALLSAVSFKKEALVNGVLTAVLLGFILFLTGNLSPFIKPQNFQGFDLSKIFLPYGVLLFALSGSIVVPDLIAFLEKEDGTARRAIIWGSLIPAAIYFLFAVSVVGALGNRVSEEVIGSLGSLLGNGIVVWGSVIGFLAVFTSFLMLSSSFQALLRLDLKFPRGAALGAALLLPLGLYLLGLRDFIKIIGTIGAVAVGTDSAMILLIHHRLTLWSGRKPSKFYYFWKVAIFLMILGGVSYELYNLII